MILHTFYENMDRKLLLQTPAEQTRLLQEVPEVIADALEVQTACKDMSRTDVQTDFPNSVLKGTSHPPKRSTKDIKSSCCLDDGANGAGNGDIVSANSASELIKSGSAHKDDQSREMEERADEKHYEGAFEEQQQSRTHDCKGGGVIQTESQEFSEEVNKNHFRASQPKIVLGQTPSPFSEGIPSALLPQKQCRFVNSIFRDEQNEQVDIECQNKKHITPRDGQVDTECQNKKQSIPRDRLTEPSEPRFKLIVLSDSGEQDPSAAANHTDKQHYQGAASEEKHQSHSLAHDNQDGGTLQTERNKGCQIKHTDTRAVHEQPFPATVIASISQGQPGVLPQEQYQHGNDISKTKQNGKVHVAHDNKKQSAPKADLIVLSDDEKEDASAAASKQKIHNLNGSIWNCMSPNGMKTGPWSMLLLKEWSDSDSCVLKWKVWKSSQSPEEAIFLKDALHQVFH